MNKNIKFFDFDTAKNIRLLGPTPKHFHFFYDKTKGIDSQSMICTDSNKCPICNFVKEERKSLLIRFKIFILDIIDATKKLFKN